MGLGVNDGDRTRDIHLGKVVLYQLSYVHMRVCSLSCLRDSLKPESLASLLPAVRPEMRSFRYRSSKGQDSNLHRSRVSGAFLNRLDTLG